MMKKVLGVILAVVLSFGVFALTGCKGGDEATNGQIVVSTMFGDGDAHHDVFTKYNGLYTKMYGVKIEDRSGTAEDSWASNLIQDLQSTNNVPDVVFATSGAAMATVRDKLVKLETIRETYPNFASDIVMSDPTDEYAVAMKAGLQCIMYDKTSYSKSDFASLETLLTKIKTNQNTNLSATLPHYWFNHLMVSYLGIEEFNAFTGKKGYFTDAKKTLWLDALKQVVSDLRAMGSTKGDGGNKIPDSNFWSGTNKLMLDGSWTYGTYKEATNKNNIEFAAFPKVKATADGAADTSIYIGGVTNGWFITKSAWNDPDKRAKAVAYVEFMSSPEAINEYCLAGGGAPANGLQVVNEDGTKPSIAPFMDGIITPDSVCIVAIDDRVSAEAKSAFLSTWVTTSGLPKLLFQQTAPTDEQIAEMFQTAFIDKLEA